MVTSSIDGVTSVPHLLMFWALCFSLFHLYSWTGTHVHKQPIWESPWISRGNLLFS